MAEPSEFEALLGELQAASARVNAQADALTLTAAFFDSSPIPAWIKAVAADGTITMLRVNRAYESAVGITAATYAGASDAELHPPAIAERAAASDRACMVTGMPQRVDQVLTNRISGAPVRLIGWKWRVPSHGHVVAICGFGQEFPIP